MQSYQALRKIIFFDSDKLKIFNASISGFPIAIMVIVLIACIIPFALNLLGIDFTSETIKLTAERVSDKGIIADDLFYALKGASHHALLEWSAVVIAMLTVLLSFAHFGINRDITTPIIGLALFCSGVMDTFHTLAALRLIEANAPNTDLIPFTWALSRTFNAIIMIVGILIVLNLKATKDKYGIKSIAVVSAIFASVSYILISIAATSENLPQTQYPDAIITRPFDVLPLVLFILASPIFWILYKRNRNLLTISLILSLVPEIILEAHMAFGSTKLFDNHFNIAHSLKILAYLLPFIGLIMEYIRTYQSQVIITKQLEVEVEKRELAEIQTEKTLEELTESNTELENFAYVASHDLQEPLRMIVNFTGLLKEEYSDKIDADGIEYMTFASDAAKRMQILVDDLLEYSKIGQEAERYENIDCDNAVKLVCDNLTANIQDNKAIVTHDKLPTVRCNPIRMIRLLQNLIGNGMKYQKHDCIPKVHIGVKETDSEWQFSVEDNGIGMKKQYLEKVFIPFKRLHSHTEYSGTGIGLAVCRKIVENLGGKIWVESKLGEGSIFYFTILKNLEENDQNA